MGQLVKCLLCNYQYLCLDLQYLSKSQERQCASLTPAQGRWRKAKRPTLLNLVGSKISKILCLTLQIIRCREMKEDTQVNFWPPYTCTHRNTNTNKYICLAHTQYTIMRIFFTIIQNNLQSQWNSYQSYVSFLLHNDSSKGE